MGWMDIIDRLREATGLTDRQVAAMEKRGSLRIYKKVSMIGIRVGDGVVSEKVPMLAVDLAAKGMRVEAPVRLKKDDLYTLHKEMHYESDSRRTNIDVECDAPLARVVWCRKNRGVMHHEVGLSFVIDTADQRRAVAHFLLEECRVGIRDPREHRKAPRVATETKAYLRTVEGNTIEGSARDIAVGGALVLTQQPIERNTRLELRIFLPSSSDTLHCKGTVVRCLKIDAREWELGIAFSDVEKDHRGRLITALSRALTTKQEPKAPDEFDD